MASRDESVTYCQNFDFEITRDHQKKITYEHCDYESVDEKSLAIGYVPKNDEKIILACKGLSCHTLLNVSDLNFIYCYSILYFMELYHVISSTGKLFMKIDVVRSVANNIES